MNVDVKLPKEICELVQRAAKLAGVSPNTVIKVLLAVQVLPARK